MAGFSIVSFALDTARPCAAALPDRTKGSGLPGFAPGAKVIYTMSIEYDLLPDRTSAP